MESVFHLKSFLSPFNKDHEDSAVTLQMNSVKSLAQLRFHARYFPLTDNNVCHTTHQHSPLKT